MKRIRIFALVCGLIIVPAAGSMAQQDGDDMAAIKAQIQSNRKALVAENLMLSELENEGFWPVYQAFHAERDALLDRRIALLREFRDNFDGLSEEQATRLLADYFVLEEDFLKLSKRYLSKFREVLSEKITLRYYQIENKMDSIIEYDLSQVVPLAQ